MPMTAKLVKVQIWASTTGPWCHDLLSPSEGSCHLDTATSLAWVIGVKCRVLGPAQEKLNQDSEFSVTSLRDSDTQEMLGIGVLHVKYLGILG